MREQLSRLPPARSMHEAPTTSKALLTAPASVLARKQREHLTRPPQARGTFEPLTTCGIKDSTDASGCLSSTQRWVRLEVASKTPRATSLYYVSEDVIGHIPSYQAQLREELALIECEDEPVIQDLNPRDPQMVSKAIRFLESGYLTLPDASSSNFVKSLDSLVDLYFFGMALSIQRLVDEVPLHIFRIFKENSLAIFLPFARHCHDKKSGVNAQHIHIGYAIQLRLAHLLPRLQQSMTADESCEAKDMGKRLINLLVEPRGEGARETGLRSETIFRG